MYYFLQILNDFTISAKLLADLQINGSIDVFVIFLLRHHHPFLGEVPPEISYALVLLQKHYLVRQSEEHPQQASLEDLKLNVISCLFDDALQDFFSKGRGKEALLDD